MRWVEKVLDQLDQALEWQSLGALSWKFCAEENWLEIGPAPLELVGGADDGESVYPFFTLNVSHLIELFDEPPEMTWDTMHSKFSMEGKIDGDEAWVVLASEPFEDEEPQDVFDPETGMRKKNPPSE